MMSNEGDYTNEEPGTSKDTPRENNFSGKFYGCSINLDAKEASTTINNTWKENTKTTTKKQHLPLNSDLQETERLILKFNTNVKKFKRLLKNDDVADAIEVSDECLALIDEAKLQPSDATEVAHQLRNVAEDLLNNKQSFTSFNFVCKAANLYETLPNGSSKMGWLIACFMIIKDVAFTMIKNDQKEQAKVMILPRLENILEITKSMDIPYLDLKAHVIANCLSDIATIYGQLGEPQYSIKLNIEIEKTLKDEFGELANQQRRLAICYYNIGVNYHNLEDWVEAKRLYEKTIQAMTTVSDWNSSDEKENLQKATGNGLTYVQRQLGENEIPPEQELENEKSGFFSSWYKFVLQKLQKSN